MLEEETEHFPRCVWSSRISVGARRAASRPCVSGSADVPVLKNTAPTRVQPPKIPGRRRDLAVENPDTLSADRET
jgi:hypothetical protein